MVKVWVVWRGLQTCTGFPLCPSIPCQQRLRLVVVETHEVRESQWLSGFMDERLQTVGNLICQIAQVFADVREDVFTCDAVELDAAAGGHVRKISLDFSENVEPLLRKKSLELSINSIAAVRLPDEV